MIADRGSDTGNGSRTEKRVVGRPHSHSDKKPILSGRTVSFPQHQSIESLYPVPWHRLKLAWIFIGCNCFFILITNIYSNQQKLNGIDLRIQNNRHAYCFGTISSRRFSIQLNQQSLGSADDCRGFSLYDGEYWTKICLF